MVFATLTLIATLIVLGGTGRGVIGNKAASGTAIIDELGPEHMRSGALIVYTSADSVFQIAAHEEIVPIPELYRDCEIAYTLVGVAPGRLGRGPPAREPPLVDERRPG